MNKIIINNEVNIVQDPINENIYTMYFASHSEALIKSFVKPHIILGATASLNYKMLKIKASSVQTLSALLKVIPKRLQLPVKEGPTSMIIATATAIPKTINNFLSN